MMGTSHISTEEWRRKEREGLEKMEKGQQSTVVLQRQKWDGNGQGDHPCELRYKKSKARELHRARSVKCALRRDKRGPRRGL